MTCKENHAHKKNSANKATYPFCKYLFKKIWTITPSHILPSTVVNLEDIHRLSCWKSPSNP